MPRSSVRYLPRKHIHDRLYLADHGEVDKNSAVLQRQVDLHHRRVGLHGQSFAREAAVLMLRHQADHDSRQTKAREVSRTASSGLFNASGEFFCCTN